ncbi:MAG: BamA/TamA family outer membrane protein [Acidobacteriia bacterium]|nr:BamA/TamA family outer membrane protein [Terriglobia bacterium]
MLSKNVARLLLRHSGPTTFRGRAAYTLILLTLILGSLRALARAQTSHSLWGQPVVSLRLEYDAQLTLQNFPGTVTQQIGEPLDPAKVSESLKRLYATGRFTELRAEGRPEGQGVALTFVARAQYFIGIVTAEGNPGPVEATALVTASRLRLGQPLLEEDLSAAHQHLTDLLVANGYYQSRINHQVERDPASQEANLVFSVEPGPPARVSGVEFQNQAAFPPERLTKVSGWHPGMQLTAARVERGLFRLHEFYVARAHLQANINMQRRVYDAKTNTERLIVKADAGPLIRVRVQGASISSSKLKNLLPFYRDGALDDQALTRSEILLEDHLQQQGYFSASVKASRVPRTEPQPHIEILFRANRGPHGEFAGYGVKGNVAVPTAELTAAISQPVQGLFPPAPTSSRDLVERKTAALLALYQSKGFLDARVTPAINDRFENTPGRRFVTFEIHEGARTTVHNLAFVGIDAGTQMKLWPSLLCKPSQPYSLERAGADRDFILDYLADHGYAHATVSWHTAPLESVHQVDLELRIAPGPQERVQRIVILGNEHTRPGIIRRELMFRDGEPVSQGALLESQRQLYELGIFNQVQITPQEGPNSDTAKTVLVGVEEARRWTVGYGGGAEVQRLGSNQPQGQFKASPRLSLTITRLNVGGRGQTLSLDGRLSNLETGGSLSYLIPRLLNRKDLSLRLNGLVDRSRDVLTFTADRKEASVNVEKRFSPFTLAIARYSFRRVKALDISSKISSSEIPLLSQPARVGMLGASYINDHRDEPADATRGSYSLLDAGVSWHNFGSQANFLRFTGENSTYHSLGSHLIFARQTQFGVETPYGALYPVTVDIGNGQPPQVIFTNAIPLPERFFMGGSESHRGFSINQAGPRDPGTGYPLGGSAFFLNSLELRLSLAQRRLGFAFFEDSGNVYSTVRKMRLLKITQSSPTDFDYTAHAVGAGVRYKTPVGPIRFDVGYNLNPPQFRVVTTQNGVENVEIRRLSHVQFFLSIGQSF